MGIMIGIIGADTLWMRAAGSVICAGAVSLAARRLYMALPARWLCEFDEAPCEMQMAGFRGAGGVRERAVRAMVVFAGAFYVFCAAGVSLWGGAAVVLLAAAAFSDAEYMIIPDQVMWAAAACALAGACARGLEDAGGLGEVLGRAGPAGGGLFAGGSGGFWGEWGDAAAARLKEAGAGALAAGGLMLLSAVVSGAFYGGGAIGTGDIKMMLVCGALVGSSEKAVMMFAAAILSSALFIAGGLAIRWLSGGSFVPMAPFIALAAVLFM